MFFKSIDRYGAEIEFEVVDPTHKEENKADIHYRVAFSQAIKHGIMTREKMRKLLEDNSEWSKDDQANLRDKIQVVVRLEANLDKASKTGDNCTKIAGKLFEARADMMTLYMIQQTPLANSAEAYAELIKQESLMASCTLIKASKEKYWKEYRDYVLERDGNSQSTVVTNLLESRSKVMEAESHDMIQGYPEFQWLKDVEEKLAEEEIAEMLNKESSDGDEVSTEVDKTKINDKATLEGGVVEDDAKDGELDTKIISPGDD